LRKYLIDTGLRAIWTSKSDSTPNFVPLTGPINSTDVAGVRVAYELVSVTGALTVQPAYRMSEDGINWSSTVTGMLGSYSTTTGVVDDASTSPVAVTTDQKLFVQFGFLAKNSSATGQVESGMGRLLLQVQHITPQTVVAGPSRVFSDGSTTQKFCPLTGGMPVEQVGTYRGSIQMQAQSGDCQIQMAYQLSDDGITWYDDAASPTADGFQAFGSTVSSDGITEGTTFTAFSITNQGRRYIRWGYAVANGSAGKSECCLASLRIDIRGT
jgi:hypothetical protein